ncbi:glycosyl transferase, group 1 [Legionella steigerwaltii]|uniref:Glycosyl transferase, group 1 n=1 Tax=Legionella steigerwaltii TaxID=460 RepID=A0A378L7G2_9GAMM|nr:glycosyltransferase [Legionella steigerwaltii]KTD77128.1 glycosyl transferase, group 1 [Legionella steigerwaltii]STY21619.1 glycosyl transferase, group 1 [Legionella steigerwaltii]
MTKKLQHIRVARVSTVLLFMTTHLRSQLASISDAGAEVTVISSKDGLSEAMNSIKDCKFKTIYIPREISLIKDTIALIRLTKLFFTERFDIIHSTTPKAGFLCALAAKFAGIPIRLHTYTGQTWVSLKGPKKAIVKFCDKLINRFNTHCYADSASQREFLIQQKVVRPYKLSVLGSGSVAGVDINRFSQENFSEAAKQQIRESLNIDKTSFVLLFVGRINRDKGFFELIEAVGRLTTKTKITLIIAGCFEQKIEEEARRHVQKHCPEKVVFTGFYSNPENLMAISEILCLPSYREGFGTVVIEAAAMGVPTVATSIYGLTDAIIDEVTGLLVEPKNVAQLATALDRLIADAPLRKKLGESAKSRAIKEFDSRHCDNLLVDEYQKLINESKL